MVARWTRPHHQCRLDLFDTRHASTQRLLRFEVGLLGLTALAEELRESCISVTAVLPGSVNTAMLEGSGFEPDMEPDDIAKVVLFLDRAPLSMTGAGVEVFG